MSFERQEPTPRSSVKSSGFDSATRIGKLLGQRMASAIDEPSPVLPKIAGLGWMHSITVPANTLNIGGMAETAKQVDQFNRDKGRLAEYGVVIESAVSEVIVDKINQLAQKGFTPKQIIERVQLPFAAARNLAYAHSDVLGQLLAKAEFALPTSITDFADTMDTVGLLIPGLSKNTTGMSDQLIEKVVEPISDRLQNMAAQMVRGTDLRFSENDETLESLNARREAFAEISSLLAKELLTSQGESESNVDLVSSYITESLFAYRVHYYAVAETVADVCRSLCDSGFDSTAAKVIEKVLRTKLITDEEVSEDYLQISGFDQPKARREILSRKSEIVQKSDQWTYDSEPEQPLKDLPLDTILALMVMTANITTLGHRSLGTGTEFALRTMFPDEADTKRIRLLFSLNHSRRREDNNVDLFPYEFRQEIARLGLTGLRSETTKLSSIDHYSSIDPDRWRVDPKQRIKNFAYRAGKQMTIFRSCGGERTGYTPRDMNLIVGPRDSDVNKLLYNANYLGELFGKQNEGTGQYVMFRQGPQYSSATDTYRAVVAASQGDRRAWIKLITRIHPIVYEPLVSHMLKEGIIKQRPKFSLRN